MMKRSTFLRPIAAVLFVLLSLAVRAAAQEIVLPPNPPNEISISTQVPTAYASAGTTGSFLIQRANGNLSDITIHYQVSGKAVAGQDYVALKGTKVITAAKNQVLITVHPLPVTENGGTVKGVRVTLLEGAGYALGSQVKATVKIVQ